MDVLVLGWCLQQTFIMDDEISCWTIEYGKPLTDIHSSPFCSKTLLASYCEFLQNIEVYFSHICVNIVYKYMT